MDELKMWAVATALHGAEQIREGSPVGDWGRVDLDVKIRLMERAKRLVRRPSQPTDDAELLAWNVAVAVNAPMGTRTRR